MSDWIDVSVGIRENNHALGRGGTAVAKRIWRRQTGSVGTRVELIDDGIDLCFAGGVDVRCRRCGVAWSVSRAEFRTLAGWTCPRGAACSKDECFFVLQARCL